MSNLPLQSAVIHNDDNDEQTNPTNNKLSPINSRITSRLIIKRHQHIETKIANNQACDEIHDLQPKYSPIKKTNNNDNLYIKNSKQNFPSKVNSSHELMQGNYYDRTRFDIDYSSSSSNHQSEPVQIDINVEDYKKKCTPVSTSENSNNKDRSNSPPFGDTSELIQQNIAQSAGRLLELNKKQHYHKSSMKNNTKSHERAAINYFPNDDDNKQRSLSPSSSSSSSSDCLTDDSSTSNKCQEDNEKTNIPYEKLLNDEEDDDNELIEQPKKLLTESSTLLNKNLSQTYGTQSTTNERSKYLSNNGYNSHGSSITTKSSSDNSGSIRTNSGSDNDEESDEEHYNNSTLSNNPSSMSMYSSTNDSSNKSLNKSNDSRYSYSNEQNSYQLKRSNPTRSEQIDNNDEHHHSQVPRFKQLPIDDPNGNNNKVNSGIDYNTLPYTSKRSLQQSSTNQTNTLSSSSHQNRNHLEQQQQQNANLPRHNSRLHQIGTTKKRKQSQQQDIIRTELIPGHRGDRDVDELVMFIDGNSSKQIQNSVPLRPKDTNKPRLSSKSNSLNDSNSNKTSSRKKSRKSIKSIDDDENKTTIDQDNQPTTTTHSIIDITNQLLVEHQNISTESHLNTLDVDSTTTTNNEPSLSDWFDQTHNTSLQNNNIDSYSLSPSITNNSNSEIISEPFVTVTHRRRLIKERRQDNNLVSRSSHFPPPPSSSSSSNKNDKHRVPSTLKNGNIRPTLHNKSKNSSIKKEENNNSIPSESIPSPSSSSSIVNPINDQSLEKQQSSTRLSSHSSSSSLSSLLKRQSKLPPVVFLNKSIDIELNDVSFGFDLDSIPLNQSSDDINNNKSSTIEQDNDIINPSIPSPIESTQSNEILTEKPNRKFQQRNNRGPQFYSGSDIRPQHHRNYSSQPLPQSSYIDPLLLLQYQQRYQQFAYMNLLRTQYISPQSQYIFLPTPYPTTTTNETDLDDETNQSSTDQIQESLLVYATPNGQLYFPPSTIKKPYTDSEQQQQQQQQSVAPIPTVYTTTPTIYPSHYFYPSQVQHVIPSHPAYFQPITSPSLLIETKSEQNDIDDIDLDDDYDNSTKLYHQIRQQSSSDIMSNALKLVYSQQRRNAQTDRFNLDDLTAYLAMKWTDTVDHYVQGDSRILLVDEQ